MSFPRTVVGNLPLLDAATRSMSCGIPHLHIIITQAMVSFCPSNILIHASHFQMQLIRILNRCHLVSNQSPIPRSLSSHCLLQSCILHHESCITHRISRTCSLLKVSVRFPFMFYLLFRRILPAWVGTF
jgi:hypothetical protein